jgi:hypothetical protein
MKEIRTSLLAYYYGVVTDLYDSPFLVRTTNDGIDYSDLLSRTAIWIENPYTLVNDPPPYVVMVALLTRANGAFTAPGWMKKILKGIAEKYEEIIGQRREEGTLRAPDTKEKEFLEEEKEESEDEELPLSLVNGKLKEITGPASFPVSRPIDKQSLEDVEAALQTERAQKIHARIKEAFKKYKKQE